MLQTLIKSAGWPILWAAALLPCHCGAVADVLLSRPPPPYRVVESRSFRQTVWTTEQGLPNNTIQALLQTRDGFLWIGTAEGLVRFDGLKFTVFQRRTHPAMVNDDCRALAEGMDHSLWIGTADGLLRYADGVFERFTREQGLYDSTVQLLLVSRHNEIWIVTAMGLNCWREETLRRYIVADAPKNGNDAPIRALAEDTQGTLWVSSILGLHYFDRPTDQFRTNALSRHFKDVGITAIFSDKPASYWLFHEPGNNTNLLYHHDARHTSNFSPPGPGELGGGFQFIVPDRAGNLWFSAGHFGLDSFRGGQFTRFTSADGLSETWVHAFCEDREGNLWIGTERGLNRWQPRRVRAYSTHEGLVNDNAWTLCESRDGNLWIGTDGGLSRFRDGRFTNYTEREGLTRPTLRALAEDAVGALWVGLGGGGIDVFRDGRFVNLRLPGELSGNKIRALHRGRDGAMWVGAELGLHRFLNGAWQHWTTADGLPHNDVRAIRETRSGALWVGTFGGGACVFGVPPPGGRTLPSSQAVESSREPRNSWTHDRLKPGVQTFATTNGLASNFAWALHEDADGALWIGTEGGLSRWKDGRVFSFTTTDGLAENIVNEILEDDTGNLWLSGEEGVYRVPRRELERVANGQAHRLNAAVFGAADGLLSRESNGQKSQPAGCRTRDGMLWFPTTRGVVAIDPRAGILNEIPPPVVIEMVMADQEHLPTGRGENAELEGQQRKIVQRPALSSEPPRLAPGRARVLEFHYTANSFVATELVRFRYRLEGHDRDWTDAGTRRVAYYTSLRPGNYRFRVLACNNHGVWNETGANFAFSLAPHFFETTWFYVLCALGIAGAGYGLHRLRLGVTHRLQSLEHQLALERERARIARDIHDDLGASLTQIGLWTEVAGRSLEPPHPATRHIRRVESTAREAFAALSEIVWAINPQNDTLRSLLAYLRTYVLEFLEAAAITVRFDWPDAIPDCGVNAEQRHHLFLVIKEGLRNILQHAAATEVGLSVWIEPSLLSLRLRDNGRGFDLETTREGGNGLANMARRVSELGGQFRLSSQPGCGTEIVVEIPLRPAAGKSAIPGAAASAKLLK